mgnify:CR=1 FL=1
MADHLRMPGFLAGQKQVRRLMHKMCITAIYPKQKYI